MTDNTKKEPNKVREKRPYVAAALLAAALSFFVFLYAPLEILKYGLGGLSLVLLITLVTGGMCEGIQGLKRFCIIDNINVKHVQHGHAGDRSTLERVQ